ncbi:MAG TPA: hypothetical protein VGJ82_14475 [Thermoanaerobaculia bacterium]|jgi:hypothetical protein
MDYFAEIESHFASKRGTPFVVNPKDWALMKEWQAAGIPLPVIIEAIDSVFEKAADRKKIVNSIHYCKHAVKELWDERRELTVGEGSSTPEAGSSEALEALALQLPDPFADRVRSLAAEKSVPRIEEKLIELEREMIDLLLASLPEAERPVIALPPGIDEKTRARTEEAYLRRAVRERFGIPRLTLF